MIEDRDELDVGEPHRELVDDDAFAALEHVDADDVAPHRTDPGRDEAERAGPVREPDADQDARCVTHAHHLTDSMRIVSGYGHVNGMITGV